MLARRFTIVCLLTTIFGMFMATLVAQSQRPVRQAELVPQVLRLFAPR